jgi:hypothetical protein
MDHVDQKSHIGSVNTDMRTTAAWQQLLDVRQHRTIIPLTGSPEMILDVNYKFKFVNDVLATYIILLMDFAKWND